MRTSIRVVSLCLLFVACLGMLDQRRLPVLTLEDLRERSVVGELGVPLGTVVEVDAVVVSGRELRTKSSRGSYLLKITRVNQMSLSDSRVMSFTVPEFIDIELASDSFRLYELKMGEKTQRLADKEMQQLEQGYVGKSVRLAVYEEGAFCGIPDQLPEDVPVWQDVGFGFKTWLVVVADRDGGAATEE